MLRARLAATPLISARGEPPGACPARRGGDDRGEDPLPAEGPQAQQRGQGRAGALRGGGDGRAQRRLHRGQKRTWRGGKGGKACHKIFSHHHHRLQLKAPAAPGPGVPAPPQHNAVTATCPAPACLGSNPALVADGGSCPSLYPVHECVFKGDVRRLSSLIRTHNIGQKDNHGNTPLHLAVMLGNKECAHLLLAHNAPVKVKNAQGWSPLAEAISYGDRQMITALLRKLKQQSRESVGEKRPRLLKALKELS